MRRTRWRRRRKPYPQSPSGMTGVQTLVPIMLDHVANGRLSLARFVDLTSAGPQRIFGLASKGRIALGYDADLHHRRPEARMRPSPTPGSARARSGRPMTAGASPAGRSAPSCAAGASCGTARSSRPRPASRRSSSRRWRRCPPAADRARAPATSRKGWAGRSGPEGVGEAAPASSSFLQRGSDAARRGNHHGGRALRRGAGLRRRDACGWRRWCSRRRAPATPSAWPTSSTAACRRTFATTRATAC